jgi:molybdopterin converting factor small subunit
VQVRVLTFGVLREIFGVADVAVELPDGATAGELLRILRGRTSKSAMGSEGSKGSEERLWHSLAVAVNREYCSRGAVLRDGDEVALLPPVSGGWCCAHGERLASLADAMGWMDGNRHAD